MKFTTTINGLAREIDCDPGANLYDVLRALGLKGVKQGCDNEGTCGACHARLHHARAQSRRPRGHDNRGARHPRQATPHSARVR